MEYVDDSENKHYNNTLLFKNEKPFKNSKKYKRIIAVGDIHGDYNQFIKILTHAKLIDKNKNWIGKNTIFVQVGDLMDRGDESKKIFDLMMKLKKQAKKKGGVIHSLLGNHEILNLTGDFRYTYLSDIKSYGTIEKRRKALALNTKYGDYIRKEMESVVVIDDMIFVHAGLLSRDAALGIKNVNKKIRKILIDAPYNISNDSPHPINTDPLLNLNENRPLWTRYLAYNSDIEAACEELSKVLKITNTTRMIVGHSIIADGRIARLCDNKLINIDIGITKYYGGRFGYLEIKRDKNEFWEIYN
ncbi:Metallo-dependent phosphatase [Anaeromyces robustus]|uniref:Metallo-dependent phosphatase n=1 Tax=Anaeromyces robustus TaxID=1754192 RepID=A0A1Y1VIB0_9FUNG|nr:Metallo-dependent phosphatase [Anaeromyces robustus]|eukprot:ORX55832.1 Metallo-dependent phosphatase [Anaeromyces robustus]